MYQIILPAVQYAGIIAGLLAVILCGFTGLYAVSHRARFSEWFGNILTRLPIFITAVFMSLVVWILAGNEAGWPLLPAMVVVEGFLGYKHGTWLKKKLQSDVGQHFFYYPAIFISSCIAAYYASNVVAVMTRSDMNYVSMFLLTMILMGFSYMLGLASVYYITDLARLMKLWKDRMDEDNERNEREAREHRARQEELDHIERQSRTRIEEKERLAALRAQEQERLTALRRQEEEAEQERIKRERDDAVRARVLLREEIAKLFADLFVSRYNLDPTSGFGQVYRDAQRISMLLTEEDLNSPSVSMRVMKQLWKEHGKGIGFYLVDRQLVRDAITMSRRNISPAETDRIKGRIERITGQLFADPDADPPGDAMEANEAVIAEYRRRFPDSTGRDSGTGGPYSRPRQQSGGKGGPNGTLTDAVEYSPTVPGSKVSGNGHKPAN